MKIDGSNAMVKKNGNNQSLKEWLFEQADSFRGIIPEGTINLDRFVRAAAIEILNNPKLMMCDRRSIMVALGHCARFGLEPGSLLGQAWLIPYNESRTMPDGTRTKIMTCHFQLGYKGLIELARRSKTIKTISAEIVYENDFFDVELGTERRLTHKIDIRKERGEPIAYYCIVEFNNGGSQFSVMSKKDAEKHRDKYAKALGEDSPWITDFDSMALKTVIIRTLKLCPISVEVLEAVRREEREMSGELHVNSDELVLSGNANREIAPESHVQVENGKPQSSLNSEKVSEQEEVLDLF